MIFSKKEYWERRNNTVEVEENGKKIQKPKPLRGQGNKYNPIGAPTTPNKADVGFDNQGHIIFKNRAFKRQKVRLPSSQPDKRTLNREKRRRKNKIAKKRDR